MKKMIAAFLALSVAVVLTSCASLPPVDWPGLVQCAPDAVSKLVGVVSRILIADGPAEDTSISEKAKDEFVDLARDEGPGEVACVVKQVVSDWTAPGASQEPLRLAAAARGDDFLRSVGTNATLKESSGGESSTRPPKKVRERLYAEVLQQEDTTMVRAKFTVESVTPSTHNPAEQSISLRAVYGDGNPENAAFFAATPSGHISLGCTNAEATKEFEVGKEYYVDFTPVS